ncbi:MAG: Uma2 family endonuclease [Aquabacterium sp.]|nr:Uma2 family endonuclease [Aquabacterium sp.]
MSAVLKPPRFANAEEYLAWEELQPGRHEYVDGEVYAMVGARLTHNTISLNACMWLRQALKGRPCRVYGLEAKLQISESGDHLYPDVMVTCDPRDRDTAEDHFVRHPWLVVEVLSDSTAAYDRGRKFELYRGIGTLTHYLLVEQSRPHAELFFKNPLGQWVLQPLALPDAMQMDTLGQPWPVASLYEDVDFVPVARPAGMPQPLPDPGR